MYQFRGTVLIKNIYLYTSKTNILILNSYTKINIFLDDEYGQLKELVYKFISYRLKFSY